MRRTERAGTWESSTLPQRRSLVLPRHRVLFVPVPGTGAAAVARELADLAGIDPARFDSSLRPVVTPEATVLDVSRWPRRHRWARLREPARARARSEPDWLRFTVVRDPWIRLWCAWRDGVLLAEPQVRARFGTAPWWPGSLADAEETVAAFRRFVHALATPGTRPFSPRWQPQRTILASAPRLTWIGRSEDPAVVRRRLAEHAGVPVSTVPRRDSSPALLPYDPGVYDARCREIVAGLYAEDLAEFGYPTDPGPGDLPSWSAHAEPLLALLPALRARHQRIEDLSASGRALRERARAVERTMHDLLEG